MVFLYHLYLNHLFLSLRVVTDKLALQFEQILLYNLVSVSLSNKVLKDLQSEQMTYSSNLIN